jgi:hypothetical protein
MTVGKGKSTDVHILQELAGLLSVVSYKEQYQLTSKLVLFIGVASIIILGIAIFYRPVPPPPPPKEEMEASMRLEYFLHDRMDYSLTLTRLLVERRIRHAESLAIHRPDLAPLARLVMDSLQNRLDRAVVD